MKYKKRKKWTMLFFTSTMMISTIVGTTSTKVQAASEEKKPTNVIMLVMDGTSNNALTLARWYKGESLALDEILTGAVRTYSAESAITDSAPAATAFATGNKSNSGFVGVLPSTVNSPGLAQISKEDAYRPVANVLEGAKQVGKATGLIATSEIQHATPAGFSAHVNHRNQFPDIAEQQVYQNIDVVLDPSLMVDEHIWEKWQKPLINEKYILVYQARQDDCVYRIANDIAIQLNAKVFTVDFYNNNYKFGAKLKVVSPAGFVSLVRNAQCVVTTSFHGTAFSIINKTPFYTLRLNDGADERSYNLLSSIGLNDRFIDKNSTIQFTSVNFDIPNKKLSELRKQSQLFLTKHIV